MQRRSFLALLALAGAQFAASGARGQAPTSAAPPTLAAAINKAGRQRMLSQRCAKCWLMIAGGVLPDKARRWLDASTTLFEAQMAELKRLQPNDDIRVDLAELARKWQAYAVALAVEPGRNGAKAVFELNEEVLASAHRTTKAYEAVAGDAVGSLINIAGRQRMLSQRMAKFYFFERLGVEPESSRRALEQAAVEFTEAMKVLAAAPQTSGSIASELALAEQQWFFFEAAIREPAAEHAARNIATTSERILEQLNLVVARYEALAG